MSRKNLPQIVTANRLLDGVAVYFTPDRRWAEEVAQADVAARECADTLLAKASTSPEHVVGPYLVDVEVSTDGTPHPAHMREVMRVTGPTVARQRA